MLNDAEMKELAQAEQASSLAEMARLEDELQKALLPRDPNDDKNLFLEIRAGTGGDESALLPVICFACIRVTPSARAGEWKSFRAANPTWAVFAKSLRASKVATRIRNSSSNPADIACSACRQPKHKAASIPRPARWP